MAVEMFQGQYISAESATKYIDYQTISDGCRMLDDAADKLARIARKIDQLKENCNRDTLSIQGSNMEDYIEFYEKNTNDFSVYISELSDTVMQTLERVYNRKQIVLNEAAKVEDDRAIASYEERMEEEKQVEMATTQEVKVDATQDVKMDGEVIRDER